MGSGSGKAQTAVWGALPGWLLTAASSTVQHEKVSSSHIKHVCLVSPFCCQQASDIQCSCLLPTQKQLLLGMDFCSSELSCHDLAASGIEISAVIGFTI